MSDTPRHRRVKKWLALIATVTAVAAGVAGANRLRSQAGTVLPLAPVRQGEFLVVARCRGELRANRSVQINAPMNVPDLRIVWLAPIGEPVEEGHVIIRFDPSSARQQLKEREAALAQAQATVDQAVAQARIVAEQDKLELSTAGYQVERAKLEASKMEIISKLQGEESRIDLALATQKLTVQQATVALHGAENKSKVASLTRARDQAQSEVNVTKRRLDRMEVKTPLTGVIVYLPNYTQGWVNAKPFKVGDQAWPGAALAEVPDLKTLEMEGKLDEIDRGRIAQGADVVVRIDALPELALHARLSSVSALTQMSWEWPPSRSFRGYARIEKPDRRLRPGMNGSMDIVVRRLPNALSIPAKALFTRHGKPIVWVSDHGRHRPVEVEVLARNPDEVAIRGVDAAAKVALVEPPESERGS